MRRRQQLEIAAAVGTAALHFAFYGAPALRGAFIGGTVIGWAVYVTIRLRRDRRAPEEYGLSRAGLRPTAVAAAAVFGLGSLACLAIGLRRGGVVLHPGMLALAVLYPVWGLVQQVLVQGMVVRNLHGVLPRAAIVAVAGLLFGLVHLPHLVLAAGTALLGAVFAAVFLRWRNVWPLGICHGWLGVLFYAWVLGRDPWREIVG